jgi:hypothetical protein
MISCLNSRCICSSIPVNGVLWALLAVFLSPLSHGLQPLELQLQITRDAKRAYSGIDDFNFQRIETQFVAPLIKRDNYAGRWFVGADISENRMFLSGSLTGTRRLYRFAAPIQYFPRRVGRTQHEWMLTPAYYSDESFTDQKRIAFEYAWQIRYIKNRKVSFVGGLRSDSRFGSDSIHPIFGLESRPNERMYHHWVFPDIYSELKLKQRITARAFLQINGGNWKYLTSDEGTTASLGVSDWKVGLGIRLKTKMPFELVGEAGIRMLGTGAISGTNGDLDNSFFITIGINTPFDVGPGPNKKRRLRR